MRAAIIGLSGPDLTAAERAALRATPPAGVILFARNILSPPQLARLMASLDDVLPPQACRMVDQEGGRVARLRPPGWPAHPPAARIGALWPRDPEAACRCAFLTGAMIGRECADAGFTVVNAPVLDVPVPGAHAVIGDRAFSADPACVASLGGACAAGMLAAGIAPVAKHIPGHGRALIDSHQGLPRLDRVSEADLQPFIANAGLPWAMTAHIIYAAQDPVHPATHSAAIIARVIRGAIGFDGVLVSDDLDMHALSGSLAARACNALDAGCDLVLQCSGVLADAAALLDAVPLVSGPAQARLTAAAKRVLRARDAADLPSSGSMRAERDRLLVLHDA